MKTVVLCGAGGYGQVYAEELLKADSTDIKWVGTVEPNPDRVKIKSEIDNKGIPWFPTLEDFYQNNSADICIVSSPIAFHKPQSVLALRNGSNVLCEKPVTALPSEALEMIKARDESGKYLGIAYQWSYSRTVLKIKQDISDGIYGKPIKLRTCVLWPRDTAYYKRGSGWAGRSKDSSGRWVLDSVANNATAHYLHNMLFILGEPQRSIMPDTVCATLMRANPIEMYDTAFIIMKYKDVEISFIATHAGDKFDKMLFNYEFENGSITFSEEHNGFIGKLNNGTEINYGTPNEEPMCPIWKVIASLNYDDDIGFSCPIEAAIPHNHIMIAALLSSPIYSFPKTENNGERYYVKGLDDLCIKCNDEIKLPDLDWAPGGKIISLNDQQILQYGTALN